VDIDKSQQHFIRPSMTSCGRGCIPRERGHEGDQVTSVHLSEYPRQQRMAFYVESESRITLLAVSCVLDEEEAQEYLRRI
jgi:hypothetical protein